jgi:DNA polymerase-3 subunit gamma/tau
LKVEPKKEEEIIAAEVQREVDQDFTPESLHLVWKDFAEQRKKFQAEFQMLMQPFDLDKSRIVVHLLNPVQDTMLAGLKSELTTYLREKLKNNSIQVTGELRELDEKKMKYTDRDKFDFLLDKNPLLKEMKDRLGLDTDF